MDVQVIDRSVSALSDYLHSKVLSLKEIEAVERIAPHVRNNFNYLSSGSIHSVVLARIAQEFHWEYDPPVSGKLATDLPPVKTLDKIIVSGIEEVGKEEVWRLYFFLKMYHLRLEMALHKVVATKPCG
ncbi:MAG: hypothetical protein Athens101428_752 [Candidatus Berkelbacteria bacterium Athens1014_28]|uniref:Uncharacterized protein n=1 Tax=Candidatus Berkelbacteria bacterium Athens1014_28 TaxID=2017145 RepID=A0A554LJQ2_9BACT|nr:MAG: hypothetical protein Athens101428_752 [Candidatus Berkelbacteria bacterium Athens1014_28]